MAMTEQERIALNLLIKTLSESANRYIPPVQVGDLIANLESGVDIPNPYAPLSGLWSLTGNLIASGNLQANGVLRQNLGYYGLSLNVGGAVAHAFDTLVPYTLAGQMLASFRNGGVDKLTIDKDGVVAGAGGIFTINGDLNVTGTGAGNFADVVQADNGFFATGVSGNVEFSTNVNPAQAALIMDLAVNTVGSIFKVSTAGVTVGVNGTEMKKILSATAVLDFPNTLSGTVSDLTVTVLGAVSGDVVSIGVPSASATASSVYSAWVSAADTVTIRHAAIGADSNPASGTFRVTVFKF